MPANSLLFKPFFFMIVAILQYSCPAPKPTQLTIPPHKQPPNPHCNHTTPRHPPPHCTPPTIVPTETRQSLTLSYILTLCSFPWHTAATVVQKCYQERILLPDSKTKHCRIEHFSIIQIQWGSEYRTSLMVKSCLIAEW